MDRVQMILSQLISQIEDDQACAIIQERLEAYNQEREESRRKTDRAMLAASAAQSAELAGGSPRVRQPGAPYGSRA